MLLPIPSFKQGAQPRGDLWMLGRNIFRFADLI
jgi:hypothetical protein